jgi:O-antigen/teichoic acid export membrane protein
MQYLDRYVIGAVLTLSAVAYYTAPFDAVSRLAIFPGSLIATLFPAFSALHASGQREQLDRLFRRGLGYLIAAMAPVTLVLLLVTEPGLRLWLGPDFAMHSVRPAQILLGGMLVNAAAQVPYAVLQGVGRPDLTARIHLIELPLYALGLWMGVTRFGITGAATAWTARAAVDALLLFGTARLVRHATPAIGASTAAERS